MIIEFPEGHLPVWYFKLFYSILMKLKTQTPLNKFPLSMHFALL